jgi:hypothetical protein
VDLPFRFNTSSLWMLPRNTVVCLVCCPIQTDFLVLKRHDRQWGRIVSHKFLKKYFRRDSLETLNRSWNDNINMSFKKDKDWI